MRLLVTWTVCLLRVCAATFASGERKRIYSTKHTLLLLFLLSSSLKVVDYNMQTPCCLCTYIRMVSSKLWRSAFDVLNQQLIKDLIRYFLKLYAWIGTYIISCHSVQFSSMWITINLASTCSGSCCYLPVSSAQTEEERGITRDRLQSSNLKNYTEKWFQMHSAGIEWLRYNSVPLLFHCPLQEFWFHYGLPTPIQSAVSIAA